MCYVAFRKSHTASKWQSRDSNPQSVSGVQALKHCYTASKEVLSSVSNQQWQVLYLWKEILRKPKHLPQTKVPKYFVSNGTYIIIRKSRSHPKTQSNLELTGASGTTREYSFKPQTALDILFQVLVAIQAQKCPTPVSDLKVFVKIRNKSMPGVQKEKKARSSPLLPHFSCHMSKFQQKQAVLVPCHHF